MENFMPSELTFKDVEGDLITIREHNGADEEVLSTTVKARRLENIPEYLSRVIVKTNIQGQEHPTPEQIETWRVAKKYYALFKSRMFSLGHEMTFPYTFNEGKPNEKKVRMVQNLEEFDLTEPMFPAGLPPGKEIILPSGKKVRYTYLNTLGERYALDLSREKFSLATLPLRQRALEWYNGNEWIVVSDFSLFNSRDMQAIRSDINTYDKDFYPLVKILEPGTSKVIEEIPLLLMDAFFWPEEIL